MDLGSLLLRSERDGSSCSGAGSHSTSSRDGGSASDVNADSGPGEGGRRGEIYQNIRKGMVATHTERRALRASESSSRRSAIRDKKFSKNRVQQPVDDVFDENEENKNTNETVQHNILKKSRKEQLEEFRLKKLMEKQTQKKSLKPAFKAGFVHHPLAPQGAGAMKPNEYDKLNNRTKKGNTSVLLRNTLSKNSTLQRSTVKAVSSRVLPTASRNKILGMKKAEVATKRQRQAEISKQVHKENKDKNEAKASVPQIMVTPAPDRKTRSKSSQSSTGSLGTGSFAPDNYEFKPINIPKISTPLSKHKAPTLRTISSASSVVTSDEADNVFLSDDNEIRDEEYNKDNQQPDLEMQIAAQPEPVLISQKPVPIVKPDLVIEQVLTPERGRASTRRSRRISGVQPDSTIPDEEMAKTPARKVKERSLSRTRRSTTTCVCCDSPAEHDSKYLDSNIDGTPKSKTRTPAKTPRTARKTSRKTTLPVLSESSPSHEETEEEKMPVKSLLLQLSSQKSGTNSQSDAVSSEEGEMEVMSTKTRRSTRKSAVATASPGIPTPRRGRRGSTQPAQVATKCPELIITEHKEETVTDCITQFAIQEVSKTASPIPKMGVRMASTRRSTRISNIHVKSTNQENEDKEIEFNIKEVTETAEDKVIDQVPITVQEAMEENDEDMLKNKEVMKENESPLVNTPMRNTRRSTVKPMETEEDESVATPKASRPAMDFIFKTPTLNSLMKRPKSTSKKPRGDAISPFVEDRRRSVKRKYSLSETKPKSSIYSMFDDIPDGDSPVHDILAKKFRSSEQVSSEEVEEILAQFQISTPAQSFQVHRLSDTFTRMGEEEDQKIAAKKKDSLEPSEEFLGQKEGDLNQKNCEEDLSQEKMTVLVETGSSPVKTSSTPAKTGSTPAETSSEVEKEEEEKPVLAMAKAVEGQEESEKDIPYFRNLLVSETKRITYVCEEWEAKIVPEIPEDIQGQIRSVTGQGRLIMAQRFKQFSGLVDNCEFGTGERTTSCMDLEGFWEMIYFQVIDVDNKFNELAEIQKNGWKEIVPVLKRAVPKKKPVKKAVTESKPASGLRAHIIAQRKAVAAKSKSVSTQGVDGSNEEADPAAIKKPSVKDMIAAKRAAMQNKNCQPAIVIDKPNTDQISVENDSVEFDGGFFSVKSPIRPSIENKRKSPSMEVKSPRSAPTSPMVANVLTPRGLSTGGDRLRRAVLTDSARRLSGMISPFVSQMARRSMEPPPASSDEQAGASPSASKPVRRSTLFDDMEDGEESSATATTPVPQAKTDNDTTDEHDPFTMHGDPLDMDGDDVDNPVVPIVSPVTKTYSHDHSFDASQHEQEMEREFDMLVAGKCEESMDLENADRSFNQLLEDEQPPKGLLDITPSGLNNSARKSRNVKFSSSTENRMNMSNTHETTPHPKSTRRSSRRLNNDENKSPNLINFE